MARRVQSELDAPGDPVAESGADAASSPADQTARQPALVVVAGVSLAEMGILDPSTALLMPIGRVIHDLLTGKGTHAQLE